MLSVRCFVFVARYIASRIAGSVLANGQNTFGVDVFERVSEVDGLFERRVTLLSELSVFILKVCDQQVEFMFVHVMLSVFR